MDPLPLWLQAWLALALAGYALTAILFARQTLRSRAQHRSLRVRLQALRAAPPPPTWPELLPAAPASRPRRDPFGRRPPQHSIPGQSGRRIIDGEFERLSA